jgi:YidC/Oxa1 family membrane protein insertase
MTQDQKNALAAIVLSALILFGWQFFFVPQLPVQAPANTPTTNVSQNNTPLPTQDVKVATDGGVFPGNPPTTISEQLFNLETSNSRISFTNFLKIKDVYSGLKRFDFSEIAGLDSFEVQFQQGASFSNLVFTEQSKSANSWVGFNSDFELTLTVKNEDSGLVNFILNSPRSFRLRYHFKSTDKKLENGQERFFTFLGEKLTQVKPGEEEQFDSTLRWVGIDFNYHFFGLLPRSEGSFLLKFDPSGDLYVSQDKDVSQVDFSLFYGKKEITFLSMVHKDLKFAVDFGMWGFFAEYILKGLQLFYKWIPNYGVAIIFLTLLIRLLTFPLQYKSFVSMKKMQEIQPDLNKLKEKFKDDPLRMQKETMDLFKRSGANPLGGCLPMLLQLPVFFAFYKVLYSAVELVDAPFIFWIHDLSNKDSYFLLPLLMTGSMFLQQKLSPNTITDPVQKKVFMFMPLVFGFIMKDLPSGLSLYILVSTLAGIAQQLIVFKIIDFLKT